VRFSARANRPKGHPKDALSVQEIEFAKEECGPTVVTVRVCGRWLAPMDVKGDK